VCQLGVACPLGALGFRQRAVRVYEVFEAALPAVSQGVALAGAFVSASVRPSGICGEAGANRALRR
jgi:hypothetical protein